MTCHSSDLMKNLLSEFRPARLTNSSTEHVMKASLTSLECLELQSLRWFPKTLVRVQMTFNRQKLQG